ncbi:MAG: NAD(P)-dependent oxidoreductase [Lautropia sp.]|nr:NAD(P)-dependent oxidoreductase [Lautropia sp.]
MKHYPIFAHLHQRPVLLVGAGEVAERKAESLLAAGAILHVVALELSPTFRQWLTEGRISWLARHFEPAQLDGVFLVVSATGRPDVDAEVFGAAEAAAKLCNTVDRQDMCSYIVPALIDRSPVQIAISSAGTSPVLARHWRRKIEAMIPQHIGLLAEIAGRWRPKVQQMIGSMRERRRFWERLFASRFEHLVARGQLGRAEAELARQLAGHADGKGQISVVGAGPGDVGLLTLNALRAMQAADIVFFDPRVSEAIRRQIRKDAHKEILDIGGADHAARQARVHRRIIQAALQNQRVVVLRGGSDPFLLERSAALARLADGAGVDFTVVPGVFPDPVDDLVRQSPAVPLVTWPASDISTDRDPKHVCIQGQERDFEHTCI